MQKTIWVILFCIFFGCGQEGPGGVAGIEGITIADFEAGVDALNSAIIAWNFEPARDHYALLSNGQTAHALTWSATGKSYTTRTSPDGQLISDVEMNGYEIKGFPADSFTVRYRGATGKPPTGDWPGLIINVQNYVFWLHSGDKELETAYYNERNEVYYQLKAELGSSKPSYGRPSRPIVFHYPASVGGGNAFQVLGLGYQDSKIFPGEFDLVFNFGKFSGPNEPVGKRFPTQPNP